MPSAGHVMLSSCHGLVTHKSNLHPVVKGAKAAAWGVCILLLTAKSNTAPLYRSLAAQFEGKLAFGEARGSNRDIASKFGVER